MDFFSRQDDVRARSHAFFIAFGLAVALAVVILYFVITGCFLTLVFNARMPVSYLFNELPGFIYGYPPRVLSLRPFLMVGTVITLIILTVSIIKTRAIKEGGAAYIIEAIGGELIETPRDFQETQLLNVVEEMALAAGLPRPQVYLLPDDGRSINAITAGLDHDDTVIAVTKGAVTHLNREELQGVVAHEFAHIFNGDYALNLIMAGWLYGLMFFYIQGLRLIRNMWPSVQSLFGGEHQRHGLPLFICVPGLGMGLLLTAGGWIGQLMAELVQSAFSREREYLADAFAVQFTRNPAGLAGAMKKIAWIPRRGTLRSGQALLMRAFFIVSPAKADGLFQTHPPLEDRIRALEPAWDGSLTAIDHPDFQPPKNLDQKYAASGFSDTREALTGVRRMRELAGALDGPSGVLVLGLLATGGVGAGLGGPKASAVAPSVQSGPEIPADLRAAASDPARVIAVLAAVFLMNDPDYKTAQLDLVKRYLGADTAALAAEFKAGLADEERLPLLALALPALKRLGPEAGGRLAQVAKALAAVDGKLDLFDIAACQMLKKPLGLSFTSAASAPAPAADGGLGGYLATIQADAVTVLSILAHLGSADEEAARAAFSEALHQFPQWPPMEIRPRGAGGARELIQALDRLAGASDKIKKNLALAAVTITLHAQNPDLVLVSPEDDPAATDSVAPPMKLNAREYELLAALAAALDIPQPLTPRA